MTENADDLDRSLSRLLEAGRPEDPEEHPISEKLSAYHASELSPEEENAIQEHLAQCSLCTERLLNLQRFLKPQEEDLPKEEVADFGAEAGWRELRGRMKSELKEARPIPSSSGSRGFFASARGGYSVAAAVLAVAVGLAIWNVNLVKENHEPRPVHIVRTLDQESNRGGEPAPELLVLPAPVILNLPTETPDPVYRVEFVRDGESHPEHSLEVPAQATDQGTELSILLPEGALRPGRYIVRVVSPGEGPWTYRLTIASPSR